MFGMYLKQPSQKDSAFELEINCYWCIIKLLIFIIISQYSIMSVYSSWKLAVFGLWKPLISWTQCHTVCHAPAVSSDQFLQHSIFLENPGARLNQYIWLNLDRQTQLWAHNPKASSQWCLVWGNISSNTLSYWEIPRARPSQSSVKLRPVAAWLIV